MTIPDLIKLLQNRIASLNGELATAETRGDVAEVLRVQADRDATQQTLDQLRTLN